MTYAFTFLKNVVCNNFRQGKKQTKKYYIFSFSSQAARRVGLPADKTYKRGMNLCDISPILLFLRNKILVEINIYLISRKKYS
jgi:hypothetical protein